MSFQKPEFTFLNFSKLFPKKLILLTILKPIEVFYKRTLTKEDLTLKVSMQKIFQREKKSKMLVQLNES